jgi:rhamnosyltransferase
MAIEELFDYQQSFGMLSVLRNWTGLTLRDLHTLRSHSALSGFDRIRSLARMPVDNLMRILGSWLGAHKGFGNSSLIAFCSRDKKLKRVM